MVGLRPVHLGDDLYASQPLREAVRAAGGNPTLLCKPSSRRAPGEHLHGTAPQGIRRTAGRGSGKRCQRYRRMAGPPRCDGADALRVIRPKVGIAKPGGKVTYRQQHGLRDRQCPEPSRAIDTRQSGHRVPRRHSRPPLSATTAGNTQSKRSGGARSMPTDRRRRCDESTGTA